MKYVKKCMAVFLVAGMVSVGFSQSAYACDKTADCYSQNTTSTCGYVRGEQGFHVVTEPNGYTSYVSEKSGGSTKFQQDLGICLLWGNFIDRLAVSGMLWNPM